MPYHFIFPCCRTMGLHVKWSKLSKLDTLKIVTLLIAYVRISTVWWIHTTIIINYTLLIAKAVSLLPVIHHGTIAVWKVKVISYSLRIYSQQAKSIWICILIKKYISWWLLHNGLLTTSAWSTSIFRRTCFVCLFNISISNPRWSDYWRANGSWHNWLCWAIFYNVFQRKTN